MSKEASKTRPFVKFFRDLFDSPIATDFDLWRLYMLLLKRARYAPGVESKWSGKGNHDFNLSIGQCVVGRKELGMDLGCAQTTARDRLNRLESIGCVGLESTCGYTVVTVFGLDGSAVDAPSKRRGASSQNPANLKRQSANEIVGVPKIQNPESATLPPPYLTQNRQPTATNKECKKDRRLEGKSSSPSLDVSFDANFSLDEKAVALPEEIPFGDLARRLATTLVRRTGKCDPGDWLICCQCDWVATKYGKQADLLGCLRSSERTEYLDANYFKKVPMKACDAEGVDWDLLKERAPAIPFDESILSKPVILRAAKPITITEYERERTHCFKNGGMRSASQSELESAIQQRLDNRPFSNELFRRLADERSLTTEASA